MRQYALLGRPPFLKEPVPAGAVEGHFGESCVAGSDLAWRGM